MRSEYSSMPLHHCISGFSVVVNAQGPGFLKEAGMISGNVIVVGFVPENCIPPLVVVWLPLSQKYLLLPTLRRMFTFITVNYNFFAMPIRISNLYTTVLRDLNWFLFLFFLQSVDTSRG